MREDYASRLKMPVRDGTTRVVLDLNTRVYHALLEAWGAQCGCDKDKLVTFDEFLSDLNSMLMSGYMGGIFKPKE